MPTDIAASTAHEKLTAAQEALNAASNWVSGNGVKFAIALLGATAGNPHVLAEPAPVAVLAALGENKYTMELRVWCKPESFWSAQFTLNEAAKKALDEAGVTGPLPAMRLIQG